MSTSPIARRIEVLSQIPLFSAFNRDELEALAGRFVDVSYRRGDTVCAEGDEGDTFFVCVSGELEVWGGAPRRIVNRLGPGEFFGEMSLLLGGQRAATVTASRNARLLAVDKAVFEQFFLHNAKVLEAFSRVLSKRLAKMARGELFRWVVLDLGDARVATAASDASDLLVRIVDQYEPTRGPRARTLHVVNLHNATSPAVAINQCEPFVIREDEALRGLTAAAQAAHIRDHRRSPAAPALHQLALPCRVVATDIETGERVAIGSGSLELAGRASSAVPMLWCPVKREGRILVDGGVSDPVPAEVVIQMGADVTIAVNAVPQLRRGVQTVLSKAYRRLKSIDPLSYLAGSRDLP